MYHNNLLRTSGSKKGGDAFQWGKFLRALMIIAIPVAAQNLLTTTGSMVDTIMLASLGENTIGAVGLCAQFSSLMLSCYWGFVGGSTLFISQYWGAEDGDGIRHSYGILLIFLGIIAIIFTYLAIFTPINIMTIYTNKERIRELGVLYLRLVGFAYPLQIICVAMSTLLRGIERVRIPLCGAIASVITNCICNYILIFGKLGLPAMGIKGAAIGTILAGAVNLAVIIILAKKQKIPFLFDVREHFRIPSALMREFIKKTWPILSNELAIGTGNMLINMVLGRQITEAIAATAIFRVIEGIIIAFFSGFSIASAVLVGKKVGAGLHDEAFSRGKRLIYLASIFTGAVCFAIYALHCPLLRTMSLSGTSYEICSSMILIFGFIAVIRMGNWCSNDTFRAAGDPAYGSFLETVFMFGMIIPVVYISNYILHVPFLILFPLCYCDEPVRYILMQIHLYSGKWIRPVSATGLSSINQFRQKHHIRMRNHS